MTNWINHSLGISGCVERARASLSKAGYFIDSTEKSVVGLKPSMAANIRCDLEGTAFFVIAFRNRPDEAKQATFFDELVAPFE